MCNYIYSTPVCVCVSWKVERYPYITMSTELCLGGVMLALLISFQVLTHTSQIFFNELYQVMGNTGEMPVKF